MAIAETVEISGRYGLMDRRGGYPNKRAQTRQRLLEAGLDVVAEHGVTATTISDVAAQAGVAVGTFYNHFPTKDELMAALIDDLASTIEQSAARIRMTHDDPAERISLAIVALLGRSRAEPAFRDAFLEFVSHGPTLRAQLRDFVSSTLADGIIQGRFTIEHDEDTIDAVLGIALEAVRAPKLDSETRDPHRVARLMLRFLGLQPSDAENVVAKTLNQHALPATDVHGPAKLRTPSSTPHPPGHRQDTLNADAH